MTTVNLHIDQTWDGTPVGVEEAVVVRLSAVEGGMVVEVDAPFHGDPVPPVPVGPTWQLWEHEVVELFVLGPDDAYTELELGPWGHHLLLRLEGRRNIVERLLPVSYAATRCGGRWSGRAILEHGFIPPAPHRINAYAIHGRASERRHLAWAPAPGSAPDFHRLECFRPMVLPTLGSTDS